MSKNQINQINQITDLEKQIEALKVELLAIGPMRPGTLTKQYKDRSSQTGSYYQLSYTHKMKSRTEYVRAENVDRLNAELDQYKHWWKLKERWVDLSIELSWEKIAELKAKKFD
ncbi:MAG: DUF6788 family protein [Verrucomicrobiales bacterium]